MSNKFSFSNFFGMDDSDEKDSVEETPNYNSRKVVSLDKKVNEKSKIAVFEPRIYSDVKIIASKLVDNNAVVINFDSADNESIKRIIDFLNGVVFTINGSIERISNRVFLFTPHDFTVSGDVKKGLDEQFH
ncbi:cell division protein SepF [Apilactobacillus xinyiensis]|uniref:Cell division protein SepF n=1 Tax=Apilactobacillus xinyiensis TaxID=2841032 RepID=A0ABT0I201_9LACO|nr:cell division protein SepF [Apilactobacillus xinyiensis]MCK8624748.1 cell division protein SepF [Apilactobacillus xinyiensis]MCL0318863.1 cell division protein SepF [Apilactobacillus xinyiensis]MCL0329895.1 cell division protein SepF [Apilactobacillus xinyiensis]